MSATAFDRAIVREPAPSVVNGLRSGGEDSPSFEGVAAEHRAYVAALEQGGLKVDVLPPLDAYPDSVFVEDAALVLAEGAILLRPGAPSRIGEAEAIDPALHERFDRVLTLDAGFVDGGDILVLPREILVGLSGRTDWEGAERFAALAAELGYRTRVVQTPPGVLHFKSACALLDDETVIATPALAAAGCFQGLDVLTTPEGEEKAANLLRINDLVLMGADHPRTADMLSRRGDELAPLDVAEIRKIDAGLSCMSLRWKSV